MTCGTGGRFSRSKSVKPVKPALARDVMYQCSATVGDSDPFLLAGWCNVGNRRSLHVTSPACIVELQSPVHCATIVPHYQIVYQFFARPRVTLGKPPHQNGYQQHEQRRSAFDRRRTRTLLRSISGGQGRRVVARRTEIRQRASTKGLCALSNFSFAAFVPAGSGS